MEAFLDSIDNFLELLLNVRNMPEGEEWQDDRVVGTLKLMAFIEKRHRPIFIRYVHRLVDFHITAGQYTEAALTLKLHADLYTFDTTRSCPAMGEIGLPEQSEFSRKELLYLRMLENLSKGESFETAIAVSRGILRSLILYSTRLTRLYSATVSVRTTRFRLSKTFRAAHAPSRPLCQHHICEA